MQPPENIIHTSLSLRKKHIEIIKNKAQALDISANELAILLIRSAIKNKINNLPNHISIKYQKRTKDYLKLNLYVDVNDYETLISARRFNKISVSWILAYAIETYLSEIIHKIKKSLKSGKNILNIYLLFHSFSTQKNDKKYIFTSIIEPFH